MHSKLIYFIVSTPNFQIAKPAVHAIQEHKNEYKLTDVFQIVMR